MISLVALPIAALLFWFGFVRSHWVAPAALFTVSGPLVAALSWNSGPAEVTAHLVANLLLFYGAFALGRSMAGPEADRG